MSIVYGPKWPFYSCWDYIGLLGTDFMQVLYLGRAPFTKETLHYFLKWRRVTRHPFVFRGLTGSQRTPGIGASHLEILQISKGIQHKIQFSRIPETSIFLILRFHILCLNSLNTHI